MDVIREEVPWWKLNAHKRVPGARGSRNAGTRLHLFLGVSVASTIWYVLHADDWTGAKIPEPPVPPPPKPREALSYTKARELPMLQRRLLEDSPPAHIPRPNVDTVLKHELERETSE